MVEIYLTIISLRYLKQYTINKYTDMSNEWRNRAITFDWH